MLYRGNEVMREVAWVVFDEIHYMRDKDRGVVWEETIILLPDKVRYVFLSATIPNAREFASWIAKLHNQVCTINTIQAYTHPNRCATWFTQTTVQFLCNITYSQLVVMVCTL